MVLKVVVTPKSIVCMERGRGRNLRKKNGNKKDLLNQILSFSKRLA